MFDFEYKSSNEFIPLVVAFNAKLDSKADEAELDVTNENVDALSGTVATQGEAIAENAAAIAENASAILDETAAREAAVEELNEKISEIPKFKFEVVDTLPETGDSATIYLVRDESGEGTNTYKEYVYSNGQWEEIGPVIDLSPYATKEEVEAAVESLREADAALDEKIVNEIAAREAAIAAETAARESADAELNTAVSNEVSAREEAVSGEAAERQRVDEELRGQIAQEASARDAADDILNDAISDEVEARVAADVQLNTAISNEVAAREEAVSNETSAREAADAELNEAIANEAVAREEAVANEASVRESADTELNAAIANEAAIREEAVANEASVRESADTELNAAIANESAIREEAINEVNEALDSEVAARESADTVLNAAIVNEASVRESADVELNEAIANEISAREAAVAQEIADRIAADNDLNAAIVNETEARVANYNDLVTSIANETAVRIAADNDLSATITNEIASERSAREFAISSEASARQAADAELNTAVSNEASAREEAVANEASARETADTELNTAISNEVAAREEAVANEASARESADAELNTAIANEAAAREEGISSAFTAIENIADDLADEVSAREQAIFELHEEIVALPKFKITIVDELPVSGDNATIYLVPAGSESGNIYTEYVYVNDAWEEVGPEKLDLSEYAKIEDVDDALALKADAADVYTKDEADAKFLTEHQDISGLATKEELSAATEPLAVKDDVDAALALKANVADVYAKADVDSALAEKVSVADFETLSGVVEDIVLENESIEEKLIGLAEANLAQDEVIATKANADDVYAKADVYTKTEVDELVAPKADKSYVDSEIYKLTMIVGDMGGAVTYELPSPAGKSFNTLMSNNGTVKLTDDVESGRFGPGMTAKNTTKLNLNGHDLTITGLTSTSTQPAIMSRGTENLTIYGKGTIDAGGGVCIEANGVDSVINLTGSTTVYRTNRSGGELIYCYAGTINITNGTFRNDGANTAYLLNCYDANYKADPKKANIIVSSTSKTSGPKFYDFNPADNSAEGEHTNFVAAGCEVVVSTVVEDEVEHTVYTVVKSAE